MLLVATLIRDYQGHLDIRINPNTHITSALSRWIYSCETYGIPYTILHSEQDDPDQISLLGNTLLDSNKYILFVNYNMSFMLGNPIEILDAYRLATNNDKSKILFPVYNNVPDKSSGFIGHSSILLDVFQKRTDIESTIQLDTGCKLFQHVGNFSNQSDIEITRSVLCNKFTNSDPKILCTDDSHRLQFNSLENYTLYGHKQKYGFKLPELGQKLLSVDIFAFGTNGNSLNFIRNLNIVDYPSDLLRIWIFCQSKINIPDTKFSSKIIFMQMDMSKAHIYMVNQMLKSEADYAWMIYENYNINVPSILSDCIKTGKDIVAPLFRKSDNLFSNFWGGLDSNGYYTRSADYIDILNQTKKSAWNVPYIYGNILLKKEVVVRNPGLFIKNNDLDLDMQFCHNLRENNELMYLLNTEIYGSIVDDKSVNTVVVLSDQTKWFIEDYLHPDFYNFMYGNGADLDPRTSTNSIFKELILDVWQFPIFTEKFCDALIAEADKFGKWSPGNDTTFDPRLPGKHENYPTQDIHLNQLGLHNFWLDTVVRSLNLYVNV